MSGAIPAAYREPRQEPAANDAVKGVLAVIALCLAVGTWGCILVMMLVFVPHYETIFRDFGVALSWFARLVINSSRWLRGDNPGQWCPGVVLLGPIALGAFAVLGLLAAGRRTRLGAIVLLAALWILGVLLTVAAIVSFQMGLSAMIESLQGGKL